MASSKLTFLLGNALRSAARGPLRAPPHMTRPLCTGATSSTATAESDAAPTPAVSQSSEDTSVDPFLRGSSKGPVFAKVTGIGKSTLKTDLIHIFEGCSLTKDDIKVDYNRAYTPTGMIVQFPSRAAFDTALRGSAKKGRLYRLVKVDRSDWDLLDAYDGKCVMLEGIPRNALPEDIERFLCGCNFDASSMKIFSRGTFAEATKVAIVRFPTQTDAMHAFRVKNRSFCLNNQVLMRVLQ